MRMGRLALLGLGLVVAPVMASQELPRPAELASAVSFWKRVFTTVNSDEGLIHDRRELDRVYDQIVVPEELSRAKQRKRWKAAKARIRTALNALAAQSGEPRTREQKRIRALFARDAKPGAFRVAAKRLRFQRGLSNRFRAGYERSGRWYHQIRAVLNEHDVPAEVAALPHVESSFRTNVISHAWAVGLWQFTRSTGGDYMRIDAIIDERRDGWRASEAAAELLSDAYESLGDWGLAITAYNHGITGMRRARKTVEGGSIAAIIASYDGPNFGFASRNFYPALLAAADVDANANKYFGDVNRRTPPTYVEVAVPDFTRMDAIVATLPVSRGELRDLNPALRDPVWAGNKYVPAGYALRVPMADPKAAQAVLKEVPLTARYAKQRPDRRHRVRAGQTLSGIAKRYGVSVSGLARANNLDDRDFLRQGQVLRLPGAGAQPQSLAAKWGAKRAVYTVQSGDTLSGIAHRHDVSLNRLTRLNGMDKADTLRPGQKLQIREKTSLSQAESNDPGEG